MEYQNFGFNIYTLNKNKLTQIHPYYPCPLKKRGGGGGGIKTFWFSCTQLNGFMLYNPTCPIQIDYGFPLIKE